MSTGPGSAIIPASLCICKETPPPLFHRQTGKLRLGGLERGKPLPSTSVSPSYCNKMQDWEAEKQPEVFLTDLEAQKTEVKARVD